MSGGLWSPCPDLAAVAALAEAGIAPCAVPLVVPARIDWVAVASIALSHNVAGLVHRALAAGHAPAAPAHIRQALAMHANAIVPRNDATLRETLRLRAALLEAGIPSLPLKGIWLGLRLYGDGAARPSRDIDFLVPEQFWRQTLAVLEAAGYPTATPLSPRQLAAKARYAGQLIFHRNDGRFAVEPHWALAPRTLAVELDHDAIFRRAGAQTVGDLTLPTPAAEDELLMLAVHGFKEEWTRLKWLADFAAFLHRHAALDWEVTTEHARAQGVLGMLHTALTLAETMFPAVTPRCHPTPAEGPARAILRRMDDAARASRGVPAESGIYRVSCIRLGMRERMSDRWRYIVRSLATPLERHFLTYNLPDALYPAYYVLKPLHDGFVIPAWTAFKRGRRAPGAHQPR